MLNEFVARQGTHLAVGVGADVGEDVGAEADGLAQGGGSCQHIAAAALAHHLGEFDHACAHAVALQHVDLQRGTGRFAHRGQLGGVAHKEGAATLARVDEAHEVVEHLARTEKAVDAAGRAAGYHGGLVDDEERVPQFVEAQLKAGVLARKGLLAVDDAVYGVGRLPCVVCQHLGGTACGSQ